MYARQRVAADPMLTPLLPPLASIAPIVFFSAIVVLAAVGGMLMASAWRGRALDWAPTCARCGFDLRASAAALPAQCPECGRPLAGAVEAGPRRMRLGRLALGLVVFAGGAFLAISLPTGVASTANAWILSMRSIDGFARALDEGDARAWRVVLDRVTRKQVSASEVEALLDRVLSRIVKNGLVSGYDRTTLTTLAGSGAAPADIVQRVYDTMLRLPNPIRVTVAPNDIAPNGAIALSGGVHEWPMLPGLTLEVRIQSVVDDAGTPLPWLNTASSELKEQSRALVGIRMIRAPVTQGPHRLRATFEVSAVPVGALPASTPGNTVAGRVTAGAVASAPPAAGATQLGASNPAGGASPDASVEPVWRRSLEVPIQITVTGKPRE